MLTSYVSPEEVVVDMLSVLTGAIIGLVLGVLLGLALVIWMWRKQQDAEMQWQQQHDAIRVEKESLAVEQSRLAEKESATLQQLQLVQQELLQVKSELNQKQEAVSELKANLASAHKESEKDNEWKRLVEQQWQQQLESFLLANIKTVKADAGDEYAAKQKQIEEKVQHLIEPLTKTLAEYRQQVEAIDKDHHAGTKMIEQELKRVSETNAKVTAVFNSNKGRGNWGEMTLTRLLEDSGMVEGTDFTRQETNVLGQRPDFRIQLPENRSIFVDSKALGIQLDDMADDGTEGAFQVRAQRHLAALKAAIKSLSSKEYQASYTEAADFVVLYVPHEGMLSMAVEVDPNIFQTAYNQKVILASPLNMMAMLQLVNRSWKMYKLSKDANDVLKLGEDLFAQAVTVSKNMNDFERTLGTLNTKYQKFKTSFESGRTGLKRRIEKLAEYGADKGSILPDDLSVADTLPGYGVDENPLLTTR